MNLADWTAAKREEIRRLAPLDIRRLTPSIKDFSHAVTTQRQGLSVLVELARATPEEGPLRAPPDWQPLLEAADEASVAAFVVPIDKLACAGSEQDLLGLSQLTTTPFLARDLVLVPEQVHRARLANADAVLLHAGACDAPSLRRLLEVAASTHMAAPVEVRSPAELELAAAVGARMVVIPAFSRSGALDLPFALELLERLPRQLTALVRGPFASPRDLDPLKGRADGIWLCGPLLSEGDPKAFLQALVQAADS